MKVLGVDIGGSFVKGAPVDTETGELLAERMRIPTPRVSTPAAVADVVAAIARGFDWKGPAGCGFPGVVRRGVVLTAANVSKEWIDVSADALLTEATGCSFAIANDADAAGLAEMRFGAGRDRKGVVLMITLGTGIGTALFVDGLLVPNLELGHLEIRGKEAEERASEKARIEGGLSWKEWASHFDEYLDRMHTYFWPDLIILGGGGSKEFDKFAPFLSVRCEVVPAMLRNEAGIIGAALLAANKT